MRHEPKQLALLISLIGVGAAPCFGARAGELDKDVSLPMFGVALEQPTADATAAPSYFSSVLNERIVPSAKWLHQRGEAARVDAHRRQHDWAPVETLERSSAAPSPPVSAVRFDTAQAWSVDWAPGEGDESIVSDIAQRAALTGPSQGSRPPGEVMETQVQTRAARPIAPPIAVDRLAAAPKPSVQRQQGPLHDEWVGATAHLMTDPGDVHTAVQPPTRTSAALPAARGEGVVAEPVAHKAAVPRSMAQAPSGGAPDAAATPSTHVDQLMQSLAAIVLEDLRVLEGPAAKARIAERFPAWAGEVPAGERPRAAALSPYLAATSIERHKIVVGSQTSKVLSSLEAVLGTAQGANGMADAGQVESVVATHADKVLATLSGVLATRHATVEPVANPHGNGQSNTASQGSSDAASPTITPLPSQFAQQPAELHTAAPQSSATVNHSAQVDIEIDVGLDIDLAQLAPVEHGGATSLNRADDTSLEVPGQPVVVPVAAAAVTAADPHQPGFHTADVPAERASANPFGGEAVAMNEHSLGGVRGGFVANGLNISFGIERAVYINGALVTSTRLNVSELGKVTGGAGSVPMDTATLGIVQSGAGNSFTPGALSSSTIGTVIQNTLDGQNIKNLTVINATANSLGVLKGINLESSLRGAVIDSLRR